MTSDGGFLEVVAVLGHQVANSAIWFEGRCNWMGALPHEESLFWGSPEVQALGPDLYGGTSGVAVFLAEAAAHLDDDRLSATALGAIRHALDHADDIVHEVRDGLYAGPVGIVYSAVHVGELLGAEEIMTRARELLLTWREDPARSAASDVMNGCAGAVIGLMALSELIDEPWLVDTATNLGQELIARAEISPEGWSWAAPGSREMHNLCGYSHGAAGIGHALLELFALTNDARFREAGERAFDYERSWIDRRTGTWADLRGVARRTGRDAPVLSADSWCNGATGIAASRIRAAALVRSPALRRDADRALKLCERHALELLAQEPDDFSLCHGAGGTGDVLLTAADSPDGRLSVLAAEVGRWGIGRRDRPGAASFACGVPQGVTPGLLLGLAGIGMFYIRLLDPEVPSPLLLHPRRLDSRTGHSLQSQSPGEGECREPYPAHLAARRSAPQSG